MNILMIKHRHVFRSFSALSVQRSKASANRSTVLNRLLESTSNRKGKTGCEFDQSGGNARCLLNFLFERNSTDSFLQHAARSFFLLACMLILQFGNLSSASPISYTLEAGKDLTVMTNASVNAERRAGIDSSLRKYSFMALSRTKTGIVHNATLPPYFNGIEAQAIRLRYGSLRKRGLTFNEFKIPAGAVITGGPVVVLTYRKIFNFTVYSLPIEYDFAGPVVGVIAYTSTTISFDDIPIPEATFISPVSPVVVHAPIYKPHSQRVPLCAFFGVDGTVILRNVSSLPNVCTSLNLGDVSLVLPSVQVTSTPYPAPASSPAALSLKRTSANRRHLNSWKIALVAIFGTIAGLAFFSILAVFGPRVVERIRIAVMEGVTDHEEQLQTALIGANRAPMAGGARTRPALETDKFLPGIIEL